MCLVAATPAAEFGISVIMVSRCQEKAHWIFVFRRAHLNFCADAIPVTLTPCFSPNDAVGQASRVAQSSKHFSPFRTVFVIQEKHSRR
jgi:hypothetical protein